MPQLNVKSTKKKLMLSRVNNFLAKSFCTAVFIYEHSHMNELINMIKYQPILVYYSRLIYLWNSVYLLASFHWKAMHCNVKRTIRWFTELSVRSTWQLDFSIYFICIIVSNVNCDNNTTRWLTKFWYLQDAQSTSITSILISILYTPKHKKLFFTQKDHLIFS